MSTLITVRTAVFESEMSIAIDNLGTILQINIFNYYLTISQICVQTRDPVAVTVHKAGCGLSKSLDQMRVC
jgi:hypothetical protein